MDIIVLDVAAGLVPTYQKGVKGQYQLIVEKSRWMQLKARLKQVTRKPTPMTFDERVQNLSLHDHRHCIVPGGEITLRVNGNQGGKGSISSW